MLLNKPLPIFLDIIVRLAVPDCLNYIFHFLLGNSLFPIKPPTKADNPAIKTEIIMLVLGTKYSDKKTTIPTNIPVNKVIPILPFFMQIPPILDTIPVS